MDFTFVVEQGDENIRIDKLIPVKLNNFTRSKIHQLCDKSKVLVNSFPIRKNYYVAVGDIITIICEVQKKEPQPENIPLKVVYDDPYFMVIDKPQGLLVHPTDKIHTGTLVNALLYHYPNALSNCAEAYRPGIVHRLDKDTSGLLIIAHNNAIHHYFSTALQQGLIKRYYQCVTQGVMERKSGEVSLPIIRDPHFRTRFTTSTTGRLAFTKYQVVHQYTSYSHLALELMTGRTHQIRVHMRAIHHPIAGDKLYGHSLPNLQGQCLHAYKLVFPHPITGQDISIESPLPTYFTNFLSYLKNT